MDVFSVALARFSRLDHLGPCGVSLSPSLFLLLFCVVLQIFASVVAFGWFGRHEQTLLSASIIRYRLQLGGDSFAQSTTIILRT